MHECSQRGESRQHLVEGAAVVHVTQSGVVVSEPVEEPVDEVEERGHAAPRPKSRGMPSFRAASRVVALIRPVC